MLKKIRFEFFDDFRELYIKAVMCVTEIPRGKVSILPNWVVLKDLLVFDNSKRNFD